MIASGNRVKGHSFRQGENALRLSIIIPVLDESEVIEARLRPLQRLRAGGHEIILVDGGSRDATVQRAEGLVDRLLHRPPGRARQMNAGAAVARGSTPNCPPRPNGTSSKFCNARQRSGAGSTCACRAGPGRCGSSND